MTNKTDTFLDPFDEWCKSRGVDCDELIAAWKSTLNTRIAEQASDTSSNCEHESTCDASGRAELRQDKDAVIERFEEWLKDEPNAGIYARMTVVAHSYLDRHDAEFGYDPYHDNMAMKEALAETCLLYTSPSPRDLSTSRMPSSA